MSALLESLLDPERHAQADAADRAHGLIGRGPDPVLAGLTPEQVRQHHAMVEAMRAGTLRGLPSTFGDLA